ncbi:M23 family metallopeptidase [Nocardia sp. NPDC101769]|uniref:M23 family metallopeptidase n=1 Tax=Nocardia sp. NPDC101769 TaxID=3364333 RepID=UPI003809FC00
MPLKQGTYSIASGFGPSSGTSQLGLDFAADDGTPFYAAQSGTIAYIGAASGLGQWIVSDHPAESGGGTTVYGQMWNAFATGLSPRRLGRGQVADRLRRLQRQIHRRARAFRSAPHRVGGRLPDRPAAMAVQRPRARQPRTRTTPGW